MIVFDNTVTSQLYVKIFSVNKELDPQEYQLRIDQLESELAKKDRIILDLSEEVEARRQTQAFLAGELLLSYTENVEQMRLADKSERRARTDIKTGLLSPRGLKAHYQTARYECTVMSAAFFDIDNFKEYNEQLGEPQVDKVIIRPIGEVIKKRMRTHHDIIGRYGGDEFLFLFPHTNTHDAESVTISFINSMQDIHLPQGLRPLTFSVGIASVDVSMEFEEAITPASMATRRAKELGKDRIVVKKDPA